MANVNPIGLDIGSSTIHAVEMRHGKRALTLHNFGQVPLPPGAVRGGVVQDPAAVTAALRQLWAARRFAIKRVLLGVTHPQLMVREMPVTNLPAKELRQSLPFQVRDMLPLSVERSLLDFCPLEDPGANPTVRGLLVAMPKDAVMTTVRAVRKAGLFVEGVDLASFALLRAASRLDDEVEALVDIGADVTTVVVHAEGEPLMVRTVPRGGNEVTATMAARLSVPPEEAEELKRHFGLHGDGRPDGSTAVSEALRPLLDELRGSFTYVGSGERQKQVTRISLCGGGALLPGLEEHLQQQLGVTVVHADVAARLHDTERTRSDEFDNFAPSAAVSIGLTLGAAA